MKKILFFLLICTSVVQAQQSGVQPGITAGSGQLIAKLVGTGTNATLSFGFGNSSFFNVPTTKAFMDSLTAVKSSVAGSYLPLHGTADNSAKLGGQLPSFYYPASNPNAYISSYTETDPTVPAYAKSLTAFSIIKASTDALYPTQTGGNASGAWGISITGNAATAAILQTPRTINGVSFNGGSNIQNTTDQITEGSANLFFTNVRARGAVSATGSINYNSSTGVFSYTPPTLSSLTNGYGVSALSYNTSTSTTVSVDNTVIAPLSSPKFTGLPIIQPANGSPYPTFTNSASGIQQYTTRNMTAGDDEIDEVLAASTTGSAIPEKIWWGQPNGGSPAQMLKINSQALTIVGKLVVGTVNSASAPTGFGYYDPAIKEWTTVTPSQAATLIGTTVVGGTQRLTTFTGAATSVSTTPTDIYTYTIPANTFASDGAIIDGSINGSLAVQSSSIDRIQLNIGGNVVWDSGTFNNPTNIAPFILRYVITRISSSIMSVSISFDRQGLTTVIQPQTLTSPYTWTSAIATKWTVTGGVSGDVGFNSGFYRLNP